MLGVIILFLEGRLALLAEGVFGVFPRALGVFGFCCTGVLMGVFLVEFSLDGGLVEGLPTTHM